MNSGKWFVEEMGISGLLERWAVGEMAVGEIGVGERVSPVSPASLYKLYKYICESDTNSKRKMAIQKQKKGRKYKKTGVVSPAKIKFQGSNQRL
ncbi:14570_t:CDS:2, partial [Dentiscutata erythropus]